MNHKIANFLEVRRLARVAQTKAAKSSIDRIQLTVNGDRSSRFDDRFGEFYIIVTHHSNRWLIEVIHENCDCTTALFESDPSFYGFYKTMRSWLDSAKV